MDVEDFKKKYEQLKDNPMYKNFCSILDTKSQVLERTAKENQELKKQLDYLRSGEYLNQLRFERDMLQHVVDTNGVPSEVYDYLDCTHRNTELLEESQELKKQLDELQAVYSNMFKCHCNRVQVETLLSQQKEFIEWLEQNIENEEYCYLAQNPNERCRKDVFEEALSKYKEIIGVRNE